MTPGWKETRLPPLKMSGERVIKGMESRGNRRGVGRFLVEGSSSGDNFDQFASDDGLSGSVVGDLQFVDHFT